MKQEILIPTVPKEYSTYSDTEKIEKTEEYYREIDVAYQKVDAFKTKYMDKVDKLLRNQVGVEALEKVLVETEAQSLCNYTNEFAVLRFICYVAKNEEVFGEESVLHNINNLEQAVSWLQESIFLLREFEFNREEEETLFLLLTQRRVSYIWLTEIICREWIVQKISIGCRLTRYLYEHGAKREAILLLMRLEKRLPYTHRKIMHFTMTLLELGEHALAYEMLIKHQRPDEDIKSLQDTLAGIL